MTPTRKWQVGNVRVGRLEQVNEEKLDCCSRGGDVSVSEDDALRSTGGSRGVHDAADVCEAEDGKWSRVSRRYRPTSAGGKGGRTIFHRGDRFVALLLSELLQLIDSHDLYALAGALDLFDGRLFLGRRGSIIDDDLDGGGVVDDTCEGGEEVGVEEDSYYLWFSERMLELN